MTLVYCSVGCLLLLSGRILGAEGIDNSSFKITCTRLVSFCCVCLLLVTVK